jgi:cytochrome c55X
VPTELRLADRCIALIGLGMRKFGVPVCCLFFTAYSVAEPFLPIEPSRQKELITLVRQDCGSCHGLTLQGGLGPALLPDALKGKPADYLKIVILQGRPSTAMPPWQRFLSEAEAEWIVFNLQKGFPREF